MAERVRRFRVKSAAGYGTCGVKTGDTGELVEMHGSSVRLTSPRWHLKTVLFDPAYVEELPAFAVGDAVRVKAGSPVWEVARGSAAGIAPGEAWFGRRLIVQVDCQCYGGHRLLQIETRGVTDNYLEPWNDAEEWDGSKWVAKKPAPKFKNGDRVKIVGPPTWMESKRTGQTHTIEHVFPMGHEGQHSYDLDCDVPASYPESSLMLMPEWTVKPDSTPKPAIVCLREDGKLDIKPFAVYESTNAAFTQAEEWAKRFPGKEYVVLQEKGSKRVEPKRPVEVIAEDMRQAIGKEDDFCANQVDFTGIRETVEIEGDCVVTRVRVISLN